MTPVAEMTNTQIVEAVIANLEAQGHRCMTAGWGGGQYCAYQNANGDACAIGGLLPENLRAYNPITPVIEFALEFSDVAEWLGIDQSRIRVDVQNGLVSDQDRVGFLTAVQGVHDDPDYWADGFTGQDALRWLAGRYGE